MVQVALLGTWHSFDDAGVKNTELISSFAMIPSMFTKVELDIEINRSEIF